MTAAPFLSHRTGTRDEELAAVTSRWFNGDRCLQQLTQIPAGNLKPRRNAGVTSLSGSKQGLSEI